ncbi:MULTISPECIES: hypothetical protein [Bradyrhizobium]|uniref:hypothetical protein n=1 Tax=Bradyrhizobium TaxID=374 RepID=UPI0004ADCD93|nr:MULTISPECIES: hypothetical protein [Bradyrhizobium]
MDRRTACLHQADAFREKAIADPEQHDRWVNEAIKWLERRWKPAVAQSSRPKPATPAIFQRWHAKQQPTLNWA